MVILDSSTGVVKKSGPSGTTTGEADSPDDEAMDTYFVTLKPVTRLFSEWYAHSFDVTCAF